MENNELNPKDNIKKEDTTTLISEESKNIPNEEKLEYLCKLIQEADQNLESKGKYKKLVK